MAGSNAQRPFHTGGQLVIGGHSYTFGSGGHNGLPSIPYGSFPITPNDIGPWGQAHGAIGINHNAIWDPMLGRYRQGIELHSGSGQCLSSGCVAVQNFSQLKSEIQRMLQESGQAFINVGPNGITITPQQTSSALTGSGALQLGGVPIGGPFSGGISPQGLGGEIGSGMQPIDWGNTSLSQLSPEQYGLPQTVGEAMFNTEPPQLQMSQAQGFGPNSGFPDYSGDMLSMVNGQSPMGLGEGLPQASYGSQDFGVYHAPIQSAGGNFGFDANPNFGALPSTFGMDYPSSSNYAGSSYSFDPSAYSGYSFSNPTSIGDNNYGTGYTPSLEGPSGENFGYQPSGNLGGYEPDYSQGGTDLYGGTIGGEGVDPNSEFSLGSDLGSGLGYSPSDFYTQGNGEALSDWNQAVQQYGYGNFGYDAQGNVVPYDQNEQPAQQQFRSDSFNGYEFGAPQALSARPSYNPSDTPGGNYGVVWGGSNGAGTPYQITHNGLGVGPGQDVRGANGMIFGQTGLGGYVHPYATSNWAGGSAGVVNPNFAPYQGNAPTMYGGAGSGSSYNQPQVHVDWL